MPLHPVFCYWHNDKGNRFQKVVDALASGMLRFDWAQLNRFNVDVLYFVQTFSLTTNEEGGEGTITGFKVNVSALFERHDHREGMKD